MGKLFCEDKKKYKTNKNASRSINSNCFLINGLIDSNNIMKKNEKTSFITKTYYIVDQNEVKSVVGRLRSELNMTNASISEHIGARISDILYKGHSIEKASFQRLNELAAQLNLKLKIKKSKKIKKNTIYDMQKLAKAVGIDKTGFAGKCISTKYNNMKTKLVWKCGACGYEFSKTPEKVQYRREWCPRCSQNPHYIHNQTSISDMRKLAYKVGIEKVGIPGKCLSKKYINSSKKLKWRCGKCKYEFLMTPNAIKIQRSWCPKCGGRLKSIEDMIKLAHDVGIERTGFPGYCLSKNYNGAKVKLRWKCGKCHYEFFMVPNKIASRRSWCPKCAHKIPPTLKELDRLAHDIGLEKTGVAGKFLSEGYKSSTDKYKWYCGKCKRKFEKRYDKVKNRGSWCKKCSNNYYERVCRGYMERIFSYLYNREILFPQTPLDQVILTLMGDEGLNRYDPKTFKFDITKMHLDGFNVEILVGFERQGKQHYERVPEWQSKKEFKRQLNLDRFKRDIEMNTSLLLIVIGYKRKNGELVRIEPDEMQDFIINQIEEKTKKRLPEIPKFDHKDFFKEDIAEEISYRRKLGERRGFYYLTDYQYKIMSEFRGGPLFSSQLLKMEHLKDIKSLNWMIRDLYKKKYLKRKKAFNPFTKANVKKQYQYYLSELGKKLLDRYLK